MSPIEHHWVCETCGKTYAAEPLKCECGARGFVAVKLDVGGMSVGVGAAGLERIGTKEIGDHTGWQWVVVTPKKNP